MNNIKNFSKAVYIDSTQNRDNFCCAEDVLNIFLKKSANQNHKNNISKTYVILNDDIKKDIVAFYTLAYKNIELQEIKNEIIPSDIRRGAKDEIPCVLLAMLARDNSAVGKNYGKFLLREAIIKTYEASKIAGIKGLFLNAINPIVAQKFYDKISFLTKIDEENRLYYVPIKTIEEIVQRMKYENN